MIDEVTEEEKNSALVYFSNLEHQIVEKVRIVHACLSELLRHFWSCFPPITPELEQKVYFLFFYKNIL